MTVKELIEELQKYPMEATVVHLQSRHYDDWINNVAVSYYKPPHDYEVDDGLTIDPETKYVQIERA
jgi:hypothetical protein